MNSEEISKLFKLDQVDFEQCKSAEEYELELSNQVDDFFFKNQQIIQINLFDYNTDLNIKDHYKSAIFMK